MKTFQFKNMTDEVRAHMATEINTDIKKKKLYISNRLSTEGATQYPQLLLEAVGKYDEVILGFSIRQLMNLTEFNRGQQRKLPIHAEKILAQGEFNRFYMRAVCIEAIAQGIKTVTVYRARETKHPRKRSEALIGQTINTEDLLKDLRKNVDTDPRLFPSINSGLSIKF